MAGIRLETIDVCEGVIYILALLLEVEQHASFIFHVYLLHDVLAGRIECQIVSPVCAFCGAATRPMVLTPRPGSQDACIDAMTLID